ncbi:MAG: hypothetical protein P1R58_08565 [bacterium]|nr:hypothetical protein [bacterium]
MEADLLVSSELPMALGGLIIILAALLFEDVTSFQLTMPTILGAMLILGGVSLAIKR